MKPYWLPALAALGVILALSPDGEACWRRRHLSPCVQYGRLCVQFPVWAVIRPYDQRLETDKRAIPQYSEDVLSSSCRSPGTVQFRVYKG
jgi:hypothetical protein